MSNSDDQGLWNDNVDSHRYEGAGERYQPPSSSSTNSTSRWPTESQAAAA